MGNEGLEWKIYIGFGFGESGVIQQWYTYLTTDEDNTLHCGEIEEPGRKVNLHCAAHLGASPEFWLPSLAESIFMVYLGTLQDPRIDWRIWRCALCSG